QLIMATPLTKYVPWRLEYDLVEGGLIIQDVQHGMFNLARDIRVTRVWVDTEYPARSRENFRDYKLNSRDLPVILPMEPPLDGTTGATLTSPSAFFSGYKNLFGLRAAFISS